MLLYDFEDANGDFDLNAEVIDAGLSVSSWTVLSSTVRDFAGNPGRAMASGGFSSGNAFELMVTVDAGSVLSLSGFAFDQFASGSGPSDWQLHIDGMTVATGSTAGSYTNETGALNLNALSDTFTIGLSGSGASSNLGTFRIDNFSLSGDVQPVPLPASLGLFAAACCGLGGYRRRANLASAH